MPKVVIGDPLFLSVYFTRQPSPLDVLFETPLTPDPANTTVVGGHDAAHSEEFSISLAPVTAVAYVSQNAAQDAAVFLNDAATAALGYIFPGAILTFSSTGSQQWVVSTVTLQASGLLRVTFETSHADLTAGDTADFVRFVPLATTGHVQLIFPASSFTQLGNHHLLVLVGGLMPPPARDLWIEVEVVSRGVSQNFIDTVRDNYGNVVQDVTVSVFITGTYALVTSVTTNEDGVFTIPLVGILKDGPVVDLQFGGGKLSTFWKRGVVLK